MTQNPPSIVASVLVKLLIHDLSKLPRTQNPLSSIVDLSFGQTPHTWLFFSIHLVLYKPVLYFCHIVEPSVGRFFGRHLKVLPLDLPTSMLPFLWIPIKFTAKNSWKNHGSLWLNGLMNWSYRRPIFFNKRTGCKVCYGKFRVLIHSFLSVCDHWWWALSC